MQISHIEGSHLTATNKRHIAPIIKKGWNSGHSARISYRIEPVAGHETRYHVTVRKKDTDDLGRPTIRESRAVIETRPAPAGGGTA